MEMTSILRQNEGTVFDHCVSVTYFITICVETRRMKEIIIENLTSLLKTKEGIYYNYHKSSLYQLFVSTLIKFVCNKLFPF